MKFIGYALMVLSGLAFFGSDKLSIWPYCLGAFVVGFVCVIAGHFMGED